MKSTMHVKTLNPAGTAAHILQTRSLAVNDTLPRAIAAKRAAHALTLTLSDLVPFQPPPLTICEMVLILLPNDEDEP